VINPAAYSHYSIAILDAIRSIDIPVIEVHISNIYKREEYRKKSVTGEGCIGVISGFGYYGYIMAINYLLKNIK
jgi:3-dehydroquinate dehydratase-2